jgi:hypothetical protein
VDIRKAAIFFAIAFLLFAVDLGCTYTTFAVLAIPIDFEVNRVFREWVVRDGWLVSIGKFTVLKTFLFLFAAWMIFKTRDRVATFILAQCIVSNHLVAISSHPTLWWMENLEHRALLLKAIAGVSLVLTFYGIRYLRSRPRESKPLGRIDLPICSQNL